MSPSLIFRAWSSAPPSAPHQQRFWAILTSCSCVGDATCTISIASFDVRAGIHDGEMCLHAKKKQDGEVNVDAAVGKAIFLPATRRRDTPFGRRCRDILSPTIGFGVDSGGLEKISEDIGNPRILYFFLYNSAWVWPWSTELYSLLLTACFAIGGFGKFSTWRP